MAEVARLESHIAVTGATEAQRTLRDWDNQSARTAKSAQEGFDKSSKAAKDYGGVLRTAMGTATGFATAQVGITTATAAVGLTLKSTVGAAADYQRQMKVLQAQSSATATQMAAVDERAKELGRDLTLPGVSARDAATAILELSKAGLSLEQAMAAAKGTLALAAAGQVSNARAAEVAASALNAFSLSGDQAVRVADLLAAGAIQSQASVDSLAQGMQQASAVFNNANQPIESLVTALALMANRGIQGSDAGTSLKTAMLRLQAPVDKAAEAIAEYNIQTRDASGQMLPLPRLIEEITAKLGGLEAAERDAALATIFGSDAIRAAQIVFTGGRKAYDDMAASVTKAGAAQTMAKAQMDGFRGAVAGLQSQLETLGLEAGQKALPLLEAGVRGLSAALDSATFDTFLAGLAGIATAAGATVDMFRALPPALQLTAAGFFAAAAAAAVFTAHPVVATVVASTLAITFLVGKLRELTDETYNASEGLKNFNAGTDVLAKQAAPLVAAALRQIEQQGGGTAEKLQHLRAEHQSLGTAADQLYAKMVKLAEPFGGNTEKARQSSKEFASLENRWMSNIATMGVLETEARKLGAGLEYSAGKGSALTGSLDKIGAAAAAAGTAAGKLSPLDEQLKEITSSANKALQSITDLLAPPTASERALGAQLSAITAAQSSLAAATKTAGDEKLYWIAKAQDLLNFAGLEKQAFDAASKVIDAYAKGQISAATAQDQLTKVLQPSIDKKQDLVDAEKDVRKATEDRLTAEVATEKGYATSLDNQVKSAEDWKTKLVTWSEEAARAAQTAKAEMNTAAAEIFGPEVQTTVQANAQKTVDGATTAIKSGEGDARAAGVNYSSAFAQGIITGQPIAAAAAARVARETKAAMQSELQIRSPSRVTMQYGEWTSEGLAIGIRNEQGQVVAAVRALSHEAFAQIEAGVNRFNARIQEANPGVLEYAAALGYLQRQVYALGEAINLTSDGAAGLTASISLAGPGFAALTAGARQNAVTLANLDVAIARLNLELAHVEPYSAREAAIKADIQTLTAWRGQVQAGIAVLDAEKAALEANKTAWDGAVEARDAALRRQGAVTALGPQGADVRAGLDRAAESNDAQSGREAFANLEAYIESLRTRLGPRFQETANYLRFLFWQELGAVTPEDKAAARARLDEALGELEAANVARLTLSAQTANSALTTALFDQATVSAIGEKAASVKAALADAIRLSGTPEFEAALTGLTQSIAQYEAEFAKLPASLRGPLLEEYRAAYRDWAAAPEDPEAQARLVASVARTEQILAAIPQGIDRQRPEVRAAALRLLAEVEAGTITAEQARERIDGIIGLIPRDITAKAPEVQQAARTLADAVEAGTISAEEAVERLNGYIETIGSTLADQSPFVRQQTRVLADGFLDLGQSAIEAGDKAAAGLRQLEESAAAAQATADPALRAIDLALQSLIVSLQQGAISAEEFAAAMARLQAQAAAHTASSTGGGSGGGGGVAGAGSLEDQGHARNLVQAVAQAGQGGAKIPEFGFGGATGRTLESDFARIAGAGMGEASWTGTLLRETEEQNAILRRILEALLAAGGAGVSIDDLARALYPSTMRLIQADITRRS